MVTRPSLAAPEGQALESAPGQGLTEYALIIALVALIVIASTMILGTKAAAFFNAAANSLPTY